LSNTREKKKLKELAQTVVLNQGNKFIKELLRKNKLPIGLTKEDFSRNLMEAIDDGSLTPEKIEEWLTEVEGWGNHHIYLFEPPSLTPRVIEKKIQASKYAQLLQKTVSYAFPEELTLATITLTPKCLTLVWHTDNSAWKRDKSKDFKKEKDGDLYDYRAYRHLSDRSVVRFEWEYANSYCVIFIQLPNDGDTHKDAMSIVHSGLNEIGLIKTSLKKISINKAIKSLSRKGAVDVQSTRMETSGGHIDLVSTLSDGGGIGEIEAVRQVRRSVDDDKFASANGVFNFKEEKYTKLSRSIKVEGYGAESRMRVYMQCKREDIYLLLDIVWKEI
jgi:hypothetical protein